MKTECSKAECPSIPGCISQGKTEQEAESNIREAIKECLEVWVCKDFRNGYNTWLWLNC